MLFYDEYIVELMFRIYHWSRKGTQPNTHSAEYMNVDQLLS